METSTPVDTPETSPLKGFRACRDLTRHPKVIMTHHPHRRIRRWENLPNSLSLHHTPQQEAGTSHGSPPPRLVRIDIEGLNIDSPQGALLIHRIRGNRRVVGHLLRPEVWNIITPDQIGL